MNVKDRPRLGRGLKALIPSAPVQVAATGTEAVAEGGGGLAGGRVVPGTHATVAGHEGLRQVPLELIDPNPNQPRTQMDPINLAELVASVKVSGILQPVLLRPVPGAGGRYQLVAGHRRTEAARQAGLKVVPAIVRHDSTDALQAEWSLVENIQREDLNPIERAKAYRNYLEKFGLSQAQVAERLGQDRSAVANYLRLLDLNAGVQDLVARGILSVGHGKVLAGVTDAALQDRLANQTAAEGLTVRKLEELVASPPPAAGAVEVEVAGHTRTIVAKSPHVLELEQDLSRKLGTKLRIFPSKRKNTGKIVINYFSLDEFDRIVERFG